MGSCAALDHPMKAAVVIPARTANTTMRPVSIHQRRTRPVEATRRAVLAAGRGGLLVSVLRGGSAVGTMCRDDDGCDDAVAVRRVRRCAIIGPSVIFPAHSCRRTYKRVASAGCSSLVLGRS